MDRMLFTRLKNEDKNTVLKNLTFGLSSGRAASLLKLQLLLSQDKYRVSHKLG